MRHPVPLRLGRRSLPALALLGLLTAGTPSPAGAQVQAPPTPAPAAPAAVAPAGREAELEARVRELEATVSRLSQIVEAQAQARTPAASPATGPVGDFGPPASDRSAGAGEEMAPGGSASPRESTTPPTPRFQVPAANESIPLRARFGPGFELKSADDEFQAQFHNLTQVEARAFEQGGQEPVRQTFAIPRQWFIANGRVGKPFEYFVAAAFGFDNINLLDAFLNVRLDDRLQFKIGRYKTPFTYEFYNLPINGLINPERSLFFNNFGLNRDLGFMAWGQLLDKRVDYAAGIFNGSRNGFLDRNDAKDVAAYLDVRPWGDQQGHPLENLNVGGSVDAGVQFSPPVPSVLRTNLPAIGNLAIGPQFLEFGPDVRESGPRAFWSLHAAWYYRQLSLIAEWQSGYQDYARTEAITRRTRVPVDSYYIQAGYFLTGETASSRGMVAPLRPFDPRRPSCGLGAFELAGRFNALTLGEEVFAAGFADRDRWTRDLYAIDAGVNWYWNRYVKVYIGWQHAEFGTPVVFRPGALQTTSDQFWLRLQLYF